ncbi:MAG: flagellar basal-body MS-ring/collar protein FliF [Lachnospiraceae bacterium]|nr:flagellar basal-body MS-ring/collar protein FliF [Lachnospiraceae bacterium]
MNANEKLKNIGSKIKERYNKVNPKLRKIIIIATVLVLAFSIGTAVYLNKKTYEVLFSGLNQQEASEIMGVLQEKAVAYNYSDGTISVDKTVVEQVKAELVYEGYPKSGFTYDVFKDNISMTSTDFEKNSYKIFELQNRIGSTIRLFDGVKDAKVTIASTEDRKYVLDKNSTNKTTASVVVIMNDNGSPTTEQVKGIQRLVAKSIPNMELEDVAVLDGNGNEVSTSEQNTAEGANKLKIEFEKYMDDTLRAKVLNVLAPIYGADNVKVSVRTTVDVDKKVREIINNQLPVEGSTKGIPNKESFETEIAKDGATAGGVPGTETNADIPTYTQVQADGTENYYRSQYDVDYLVNKLTEQAQIDSGSISDISVSVTINGKDTGEISNGDVVALVGNTVGIEKSLQEAKVTVVAAPFYNPNAEVEDVPAVEGINNWIIIGAIASGVLLILIIIIILVVRHRRKKRAEALAAESAFDVDISGMSSKEEQELYLKNLLAKQQEERENQILSLNNERAIELKNKVREISEESPEIAAQLIKTWLKGGE